MLLTNLRGGVSAASRYTYTRCHPSRNLAGSVPPRFMPVGDRSPTLLPISLRLASNNAAPSLCDPLRLQTESAIPQRWNNQRRSTRGLSLLHPNPSRQLSGTARHLTEKNEKGGLTPNNQDQPSQQQKQLKGIRKVLPSLTPHENIYTVPNILTFSRLVAAPFIGYAILHDAHTLALGLFAYAGVSDLLDGWIARRWKLQTVVGSVVDPMADKILMTVLTVTLAMQGALPVWLAAIILGRDAGLGIAAIYYRWISLPPPKTFTRYWDFSLPSAEVRPTTISKYNTFLQLNLIGATMVAPFVTADIGAAMMAFQYLVATTTVWSGLSYVFSKDAVRILSSENKGKDKDKDQQK